MILRRASPIPRAHDTLTGEWEMDQVLLGKIALVTGAARGIGRATALAFAHAGADVIGADIAGPVSAALEVRPSSPDDLAETGTAVREAGRRWLGLRFDQRDIASIRAMASEVRAAFGGLDILFANAGVQGFKPLLEMTDEDWRVHIDVNLTGTANVFRVFAPMLVERGGGASSPPRPRKVAMGPNSARPIRPRSGA
jgi:NAD(P)-dependent dehydrogenase (short-subunit alcohol dehydrogenase family)